MRYGVSGRGPSILSALLALAIAAAMHLAHARDGGSAEMLVATSAAAPSNQQTMQNS